MTLRDPSIPLNDPDQFVIDPPETDRPYLGDANVVQALVSRFTGSVINAYDGFLAASMKEDQAQAHVEALIHEYGGIFMGRDTRYQIAPWQGKRMTGKLLAALPNMKGDDDPGDALFRHLALQCIKATVSLSRGTPESVVGPKLKEIMEDVCGRILGVIV